MIKEAWKTAEYFDSQERVRNEARRIARMLQTSKYAIAFTGEYPMSFTFIECPCYIILVTKQMLKNVFPTFQKG